MNNDPIPIRSEGANFFDKIVFVMAPKINPAPAILTRKPYSLSVSSNTSFANDSSSESVAVANANIL
ncbi:Uncharacterised protein [Streptococcus pneumoniae]|nr:Uncharacterised protein [Streptococcus pneumoniae]